MGNLLRAAKGIRVLLARVHPRGTGLRLWQGRYEDHDNTWVRWVDAAGDPIPTGAEQAEQQREIAQLQRQRAERLAEQLRRLGIDPEAGDDANSACADS